MEIRWIDQYGIAHRAEGLFDSKMLAWCWYNQKEVFLNRCPADDDAPEATCLWCIAETRR